MASPPAPLKPGEPLTADWLNRLVRFVMGNRINIDPSSGLTGSEGPDGHTIGLQSTPDLWIKITAAGPSGFYAWTEQVAIPAPPYWKDGPRGGTLAADPAYEANGNATLAAGYIVEATRDKAIGRLTIRARPC